MRHRDGIYYHGDAPRRIAGDWKQFKLDRNYKMIAAEQMRAQCQRRYATL